jgi:hypothetical protein
VSQHLKILRDAGLVQEQREWHATHLSADAKALGELRAYVDEMWRTALGRFRAVRRQEGRQESDEREQKGSVVCRAAGRQGGHRTLCALTGIPPFTEDLAAWWPLTTHHLSDDPRSCVMEAASAAACLSAAAPAPRRCGASSSNGTRRAGLAFTWQVRCAADQPSAST